MCKECSEHGEKGKWYLEEKNYILEKLVNDDELQKRIQFLERFQGDRRTFYMNVLEESIVDVLMNEQFKNVNLLNTKEVFNFVKEKFFNRFEHYHGSQVVPLEDALKIVDIPEKIYLFNCVCKQIYDGEDRASCLCFNTLGDVMNLYPDYHVNKFENNIISKEQAKEILIKESSEGSIHCTYYYIKPYIGALCNCRLPFCPNLKNRIWGDIENALQKSEYLASIEMEKCKTCKKPDCLKYCNFGALKLTSDEINFNTANCFGCGSCRQGCSKDAIALVNR